MVFANIHKNLHVPAKLKENSEAQYKFHTIYSEEKNYQKNIHDPENIAVHATRWLHIQYNNKLHALQKLPAGNRLCRLNCKT
jgi:hypothetical protein